MVRGIVVVFCGPHNNDGSISNVRINRAIEEAHQLGRGTLLLIAGDGNCGSDVRYFVQRAELEGIKNVVGLYDSGRCTLSDARVTVREIKDRVGASEPICVHLVTDWWHMSRAAIMLLSEAQNTGINPPLIKCVNVEGPMPPEHVLRGEIQGISDYLAGTYGQRQAYEDWGKPAAISPAIINN